jgi:hypothetical protein
MSNCQVGVHGSDLIHQNARENRRRYRFLNFLAFLRRARRLWFSAHLRARDRALWSGGLLKQEFLHGLTECCRRLAGHNSNSGMFLPMLFRLLPNLGRKQLTPGCVLLYLQLAIACIHPDEVDDRAWLGLLSAAA